MSTDEETKIEQLAGTAVVAAGLELYTVLQTYAYSSSRRQRPLALVAWGVMETPLPALEPSAAPDLGAAGEPTPVQVGARTSRKLTDSAPLESPSLNVPVQCIHCFRDGHSGPPDCCGKPNGVPRTQSPGCLAVSLPLTEPTHWHLRITAGDHWSRSPTGARFALQGRSQLWVPAGAWAAGSPGNPLHWCNGQDLHPCWRGRGCPEPGKLTAYSPVLGADMLMQPIPIRTKDGFSQILNPSVFPTPNYPLDQSQKLNSLHLHPSPSPAPVFYRGFDEKLLTSRSPACRS